MELGVQPPLKEHVKTPTKARKPKPKPKPVRGPAESQRVDEVMQQSVSKIIVPQRASRSVHPTTTTHPRYNIFVHGCSNTAYKVISLADEDKYAFLLASRNFLGEHPRQDIKSLMAVRRLKPFWSVGGVCYHWLKNKLLNAAEEVAGEDGEDGAHGS